MMKKINNNDILKIKAVEKLENVEITEYTKNVWISKIDEIYYMIIKRQFQNNFTNVTDKNINLKNAICEIQNLTEFNNNSNLEVKYGDVDSIIVDMHGIDNFMFAKSLIFNDYDVRKMVIKLGLLDKNKQYFRFGCSGARECAFHPGGEVFESSLINGNDGSGISQSISGYLPKDCKYSKSISLHNKNKQFLREERIVYSHTAFLKECEINNSKCICVKIKPVQDNVSLLDILYELANQLNLHAYSIQICIKTNNTSDSFTNIKGRVLKHLPKEPFKELQEATDIGLEQLFRLENEETMYGVGTNYLRYEPEWKEFTGGRQYEKRGHIHATITGNTEKGKHEVFHLRDVFVSSVSDIQLVLTPIKNVYKIYPIDKKDDVFYCKTTNKNIDLVIENIQNLGDI